MSILTNDSLRRAILDAAHVVGFDLFPREFVYMYGLFFAPVLAIFYLPLSFSLRGRARWLAERLRAQGLSTSDRAKTALSRIEAEESPLVRLTTAISILSPLITSLLPGLINLS